ncbi:hypothetical protein Y077_16730 [Salmonella enterica subsp. enterica serovar Infantis str. CVM N29304]|nr:hypothetical protein BAR51_18920 [Salmonella enterica subsp. enterica serovar Infantis]ETE44914.1 hypothetical protein M574_12735 [Salmonella enterica subsp. enterica serovar Infantis str. 335-3]KTM62292.1 hypothetical protein IN32_22065 [Salmonella enterica]OLW62142.1 hypothetical protein Y069_12715 [Salmonella enterica subsp. enterica serovar Infantis str. CVM N15773]OLW64968.1 hypothetical protein Y070_02005 [Salmonella enterica subsp. enterica serovar Infantis str. CVM N19983]OLW66646.1
MRLSAHNDFPAFIQRMINKFHVQSLIFFTQSYQPIPQNKSHIILIIFLRLSLNIPLFDKVAYNTHIIALILPIIKINMDILLIIFIKHQCPYLFDEIHWRIHHVMEFLFIQIAN